MQEHQDSGLFYEHISSQDMFIRLPDAVLIIWAKNANITQSSIGNGIIWIVPMICKWGYSLSAFDCESIFKVVLPQPALHVRCL